MLTIKINCVLYRGLVTKKNQLHLEQKKTDGKFSNPCDNTTKSSTQLSPLFPRLIPDTLNFLFYLGFVSRTLTNHRTAREGGGYFINSFLQLPPALQTLRQKLGNYCRELISTNSQEPDWYRKPLVSERKSLTTKLRAQTLNSLSVFILFSNNRKKQKLIYKLHKAKTCD